MTPKTKRISTPKVLGIRTSKGLQTYPNHFAMDSSLFNNEAGMGTSIDKTATTIYSPNDLNQQYASLANMYQYWLPRKIVDLIPNEATRKGWDHKCPSLTPEQLSQLKKADVKYKVKEKFNLAWKWDRLFGGGLVVYLFDLDMGLFNEPLDKDKIRQGSLLGIDVYDPWQSYAANIEFNDILSEQYRKPVSYTLGAPGYMMINRNGIDPNNRNSKISGQVVDGAMVHWSRVNRFDGLPLPWYNFQNNWYWGQSLLASVYDTIMNSDLVSTSAAQLLFKLSVPVFQTPDLANIVSDPIAKEAFIARMNLLNTMMSNNHMAIIDKDEELSNLEQTGLASIDSIIERFYVLVSAASGIPVTRLVGESARGLNATGEGDENNFIDTVEAERTDKLTPRLNEFYDIFFPAEFGIPRPADHEIEYPSLYQEKPESKANRQTAEVANLSTLYNDGAINKRIYVEEVQEKGIVSNISKEDKAELIAQPDPDEDDDFQDMEDANEMGGVRPGEEDGNPFAPGF